MKLNYERIDPDDFQVDANAGKWRVGLWQSRSSGWVFTPLKTGIDSRVEAETMRQQYAAKALGQRGIDTDGLAMIL